MLQHGAKTASNFNLIGPHLVVTSWFIHPIEASHFNHLLSCWWIRHIKERNIPSGSHVTVEATLLSDSSSSPPSSPRHQVACDLPSRTTSQLPRLREQQLGAAAGRRSEEDLAATRSAVTLRSRPSRRRRVCRGR